MALRGALDRISLPLARSACAFVRVQGWFAFGHARIDDHARELGRSGRWLRDLAALGDTLDRLPRLADAITADDGCRPLGRVAALLVGGIASASSLDAWMDRARSVSVRELRRHVREAREAGSDWPLPNGSEKSAAPGDQDGGNAPFPSGGNEAAHPPDDVQRVERSLVRLLVPEPVLAAFDEALDLYRAVEGHETTVTSFVEALVAEAIAGGAPPDASREPLKRGPDRATVEEALARSTDCWAHLSSGSEASWALALAGTSLARLEAIAAQAGVGGPAELDRQLRELLALENEMERRLGRLLAVMAERNVWSRLRFAGVGHYAEERLGLARTAAEDRLRAARSLSAHPALRASYESGRVGIQAALLVARILGRGPPDEDVEEVEAAWTARAEGVTLKRLRDEARALGRLRSLQSPSEGAPLDDASWHRSLRRDPGTTRRRVRELGRRALPHFSPDVFLRLRLPEAIATDFLATIEGARVRLAAETERVPWDEPWPEADASPSLHAARMHSVRCRRVPAWVGLLALLEEFVETWDPVEGGAARRNDEIFRRDGWRCTAPACTSRRHLEDHHLVYRSRGGGDELSNRTCLCRFHHQRGEHGGLASACGTAPLGILWRLGRPELGQRYRNERRV